MFQMDNISIKWQILLEVISVKMAKIEPFIYEMNRDFHFWLDVHQLGHSLPEHKKHWLFGIYRLVIRNVESRWFWHISSSSTFLKNIHWSLSILWSLSAEESSAKSECRIWLLIPFRFNRDRRDFLLFGKPLYHKLNGFLQTPSFLAQERSL